MAHVCEHCGKEFKTGPMLGGHKGHCADNPNRRKTKAEKEAEANPIPGVTSNADTLDVTPTPPTTGIYPPKDLVLTPPEEKRRQEEEAKAKAEAGKAPIDRLLDTTGWWKAIGEVLDDSLLKGKQAKVGMTDTKAKVLDASLNALGFSVKPAQMIELPNWVPFAITASSIFGAPLLAAYAPEFFKSLFEPRPPKVQVSFDEKEEP